MGKQKPEEFDPHQRDEKGDIIYPPETPEFKEKVRMDQFIYSFREWFDSPKGIEYSGFYPVYDQFREQEHETFKGKIKFHRVFTPPEKPPYDDYIKFANNYEFLLNKYFADVLAYYQYEEETGRLKFEKTNFYLSENTFIDITKMISQFNLKDHSDFIFYLIAAIQHIYLEDIEYHERPEEIKRKKAFPKEVDTLIRILELSEIDYKWNWEKDGTPPDLEKVIFKFKHHKPNSYTISDHHLISNISKGLKEYWNNGSMKNWKQQLELYPNIYTENEKDNNFRYRIAKALHNFFIEEKIFVLEKDKKTSDSEMLCIARILEFAHIKTKNKISGELRSSYDQVEQDNIVRNIRQWIDRREYKQKPKVLEIPIRKEILYKYFEKPLIDSVPNTYQVHELNQILGICVRFNIENLFPEIALLFQILDTVRTAWNFEAHFMETKPEISPEYYQLIKLIKSLNQNSNQLSDVKITQKDGTETTINSTLLLNIVSKSLSSYYNENHIDFKFDLLKPVDDKPQLKEPFERFLPKFCQSFYNLLLNEVELTERDFKPSHKFYKIIGLVLENAGYFDHKRNDENYLMYKVQELITESKFSTN